MQLLLLSIGVIIQMNAVDGRVYVWGEASREFPRRINLHSPAVCAVFQNNLPVIATEQSVVTFANDNKNFVVRNVYPMSHNVVQLAISHSACIVVQGNFFSSKFSCDLFSLFFSLDV
jgi:hypothetical protein